MTDYAGYTISGDDMMEVMVLHGGADCCWTHFAHNDSTVAELLAAIDDHDAGCAPTEPPLTLVRAVETCMACPAQWDAWDADGQTYYLRYRSGIGTVEAVATPTTTPESLNDARLVAEFFHGDRMAGSIELELFCRLAGIRLAGNAEITPRPGKFYEHNDRRTEHVTTTYPELVDRVREYEASLNMQEPTP